MGGFPGGPPDQPPRGPPVWAGDVVDEHAIGLDRAEVASSQALSKSQRRRAAEQANNDPANFELDHNGALAIRGEVLATGLDAMTLAQVERKGFVILRREEIAGLGTELIVLAHPSMSAVRARQLLRRIAPHATCALNHVMFESGMATGERGSDANDTRSASRRTITVGMIDSGVSA
ncbi:MAG: hypothetical protein KGP14_15620, partial [Betaproteobacteria bacterium]|nr:hypothetical protein [Betaproteobacteria bacterium]